MEKNLTTGSVLKNIVLFSLPYLLSYFFADALRYGGFVYNRSV